MTSLTESFAALDKATGDVIGEFKAMNADDVAALVMAARAAGRSWHRLGFARRCSHLSAWARDIVAHSDDFISLIHRECGKPYDDAYIELAIAVDAAKKSANQAIVLKLKELDRAAGTIQGGENPYPAPSTGLGQIVRSLSALATVVGTADSAPTRQAEKSFAFSDAELSQAVSQWQDLKSKDIAALNQELSHANLAEILEKN